MAEFDPELLGATGASEYQIANFPKNEHWRRCTVEESIPCATMVPVP
jgi:hypothetical protein